MRVDVAIWLAAAGLHETGRLLFSRADLLREVSRQFPEAGASAALYIDVNVKATASRMQIAYNYLYPTARGTYRLCRVGDKVADGRKGLPLWPDERDVEPQYRPLWEKWHGWQAHPDVKDEVAIAVQDALTQPEVETEGDEAAAHYRLSSYREAMLEHLLIGELMRALWPTPLEVCKPQVDAAPYDLVLECRGVLRHVRLKTSTDSSITREANIRVELAERVGGCVVWTRFDPETFVPTEFWWFGGAPGEPLPDIRGYKVARHTKANALGVKGERPSLRKVSQSAFTRVADVTDLVQHLFGKGVK